MTEKQDIRWPAFISAFVFLSTSLISCRQNPERNFKSSSRSADSSAFWRPRDINAVSDSNWKQQLLYGKELIAHTSKYFGPHGSITSISNGLNCQNCHLQAGTAVFGNNYGSVYSLYPKYRARSGLVETAFKRVKDCFERSLNGKAPDSAGKEMQAMLAYINFIGSNVPKGVKAAGSGLKDLAFLSRAADSSKGKIVYQANCQTCHQPEGHGLFVAGNSEYIYPALWGEHSYNDGAGLFRLSNIARFVKYNMPLNTSYKNPRLTDEQAWDVAAYICSQQRPHGNREHDWPAISTKPFDQPFGPYADPFSEKLHKYGPFKEILEEMKKKQEIAHLQQEKNISQSK